MFYSCCKDSAKPCVTFASGCEDTASIHSTAIYANIIDQNTVEQGRLPEAPLYYFMYVCSC